LPRVGTGIEGGKIKGESEIFAGGATGYMIEFEKTGRSSWGGKI
jgi:hypothetical protein